ncbi:hypothetical protein BBF96_04165 [Anoxybacter fermentans]|uniref:Major facilitator superfamily (MFS) profile domain-containing protein n=1 Tax=Anoxybacter fermentans TaxID=1323375 RepID=A0A3Q9HPK3_9FIRM|nr:MFS transporter [Anoxybacter fermentans]AZR72653.1 hypothetical protein BBF96_04165 [Anoxybacter fermentans]
MQQVLEERMSRFNAEVERYYRWNYWFSIIDGANFALGMGFVSLYTILPLFVLNLTNSKVLISLVTALSMFGIYLPQIFIANYVERVKSKKQLTAFFGVFQRLPWLALAVFVYIFANGPGVWLLTGFFFFYGIYSFACGFCIPPWFDLTVKMIPEDRRGRYFGYRSFACGVSELIGAGIASWVLKVFDFPYNFALLFALTFVAVMISFLFFIQLKEPDYPNAKKRVNFREYFQSLPHILHQHKNFRFYIMALIFIQFYVMANALYTASVIERLGLTQIQAGVQVGIFTALLLGFQTVSFPFWGHLSDRFGHRQIIVISAGLNIAAVLIAAIGIHLYFYYLVFIFAGVAQGANRISLMAIIPEFCAPEDCPTFLGLFNSISGLSITLASFAGGIITDIFNYEVTFILTGLLVMIGLWILLKQVEDPQKSNKFLCRV